MEGLDQGFPGEWSKVEGERFGLLGGHLFEAAQSLRGWEAFLVDLLPDCGFAEALLDHLAEANIRRFRRFAQTVGRYVHVIHASPRDLDNSRLQLARTIVS